MRLRVIALALVSGLAVQGACTAGGHPTGPPQPPPPPPPPPTADFSLTIGGGPLSTGQGSESGPVSVNVNAMNGFTDMVNVTINGLPAGVKTTPKSPFMVAAGASQLVTFSVSAVAPAGNSTVSFAGTNGTLSHNANLSLTVTPTTPNIHTSQQGSVLYLETDVGNESSRVGLEMQWGGAVVEASWNGTNVVNYHDTGREVQAAVYDGTGGLGPEGWDPVQGGDKYDHGSPVLSYTLTASSIYTKTQPYQWNPDNNGGSPTQPVLGDVFMEQTVSPVPNHPRAFQLHYKITHFGTDHHTDAIQEFPAVYVNLGFDQFVYYGGTTPWTNGQVTATAFPPLGQLLPTLYESEKWGAYVNGDNMGLAVYVPAQYPYGSGFTMTGSPGPTGSATSYYHPDVFFAFGPGAILEGDIYLIVGDYRDARVAIYDLKNTMPASDIFPPFGSIDAPVINAQLSGTVNVRGWTFDDAGVSAVDVLVDGVLAGSATYGTARPDVATVWPHAPTNCGYTFSLNTTAYANGAHTIEVRLTDIHNNTAALAPVAVNIQN